MARKRRSRTDRESSLFANVPLAPSLPVHPVTPAIDQWRNIQDRREFSFDGQKSPRDHRGVPARVAMKSKAPARVRRGPGGRPLKSHVTVKGKWHEVMSFADKPNRVLICLRRKVRRAVLFAKGRTRSGRGSPKRRNEWSEVYCK